VGQVKIKRTKVNKEQKDGDGFYMMQTKDGVLQCSCGCSLIKEDEHTLRCPGGNVLYRPQDGDVVKNKWGDIMLKLKSHGKEDSDGSTKA